MKKLLLMVSILAFFSDGAFALESLKKEHEFKCAEVNSFLYRCENQEVVCYMGKPGSDMLQCKFK